MFANIQGWRRILLGLLAAKLCYLTVVCLALKLHPNLDEQQYYGVMRHWPMEGRPVYASHFGTWDAAHYLYLRVFLHLFYSALRLNLYLANFLAILLVTLWNFGMNARFNWRIGPGRSQPHRAPSRGLQE